MSNEHQRMSESLSEMHRLEEFLFALLPAAITEHAKPGQDLCPLVEAHKLTVPGMLRDVDITYDGHLTRDEEFEQASSVTLIRPGNPAALGLTIGCIRLGRNVKVCLECGWFYCKIVIKGRF